MVEIILLGSTSAEQVDQTARRAIDTMERQFPDRVRGYYLVGSYAAGEAIPVSDIDIVVMFEGGISSSPCRPVLCRPRELNSLRDLRVLRGFWRLLDDQRPAHPRRSA
jgi:predicted nucleotidyltransferase